MPNVIAKPRCGCAASGCEEASASRLYEDDLCDNCIVIPYSILKKNNSTRFADDVCIHFDRKILGGSKTSPVQNEFKMTGDISDKERGTAEDHSSHHVAFDSFSLPVVTGNSSFLVSIRRRL